MKIYFDGCSHTWGAELQNPQQSRYSKLVCDYFGAEEYNIALQGGSNMRLARNILDHDLSEYDIGEGETVENSVDDFKLPIINSQDILTDGNVFSPNGEKIIFYLLLANS